MVRYFAMSGDPNIVSAIIAAVAALVGATVGGLFVMWSNIRTSKLQLEALKLQMKAQAELKARELFFGLYRQRIDDSAKEVRELGRVIGEMSATRHLPVPEEERFKAFAGFIGMLKPMTEEMADRIREIEVGLEQEGILDQKTSQLEFIRTHLRPDIAKISPANVDLYYDNLTKAMSMFSALGSEILVLKSERLFKEYLPPNEGMSSSTKT